jgi:hypothetical protein
VKDSK